MDTLNKILYQIRLHNLTDKAFEDQLGFKNKTVDSWKRGNSASYQKYISRIADYFGVTLDYLMRDSGTSDSVLLSGIELKKLRMAKKLKQDAVAKALGVTVTVYSGWERGVASATNETLLALANFFKVEKNVLLEKNHENLPPYYSMMERASEPINTKTPKSLIIRCMQTPTLQESKEIYELTQNEFEFLQDTLEKIITTRKKPL